MKLQGTPKSFEVEVIEDAQVLKPNNNHKNFTETGDIIKKGTIINGDQKIITGKRRGEPFSYRLFQTDTDKLIYLNKVKPMKTTEVTLGADSAVTPTVVDIKSKKILSIHTIAGTVVGAGAGLWFSKHKKYSTQKTVIITAVGAIAGFFAGRYMEKSGVFVQASK